MRAVGVRRPARGAALSAGSTNNTFMDPVLGYNGFARFLGHNHRRGNRFALPPGYEMPPADRAYRWRVSAHYTAVHIGNVAVYELTAPTCADAPSRANAK